MDVEFTYTRDDWTHINTQLYKDWLYGLRPLTDSEYWTCWLLLVTSLVGGLACTAFLGYALWSGHAWYMVAAAAVALLLLCGMVLETVNPRREAVRGVVQEMIFRLNWDTQLVAKMRDKRDGH